MPDTLRDSPDTLPCGKAATTKTSILVRLTLETIIQHDMLLGGRGVCPTRCITAPTICPATKQRQQKTSLLVRLSNYHST